MPIHPDMGDRYPKSREANSRRVRFQRAGNKSEKCGDENYQPHPDTGSRVVLTVAHLDHKPGNNADDNLAALCHACHNRYDGPKRAANRKQRQIRDAGHLHFAGLQLPLP